MQNYRIKDGGKIMNPLDRNVIDKMSSAGILPLPEKISKLENPPQCP